MSRISFIEHKVVLNDCTEPNVIKMGIIYTSVE